ncbi:MAG: sigma-70 family RNA polymerase sigma factor [candidate division NC10 bacterium]|nr:sigma-70 family RNA polymerase sigma factor [candidate division NC10 bacterium]
MSQPSDQELMLAVKAGDRAAFEALYRRYRDRLHAFLVRYTGDPATAQDLFQETFLRVFRDRARYEPRAAFATWLFTIARNLSLDSLKKPAAKPVQSEAAIQVVPDPAPDALQGLERREADTALRRALTSLPEDDRAILLLSRFEGLRYSQIAEILGTSEGAVKVRAHRALQALRRVVKA